MATKPTPSNKIDPANKGKTIDKWKTDSQLRCDRASKTSIEISDMNKKISAKRAAEKSPKRK